MDTPLKIYFAIAGKITAVETIWIIGEDFVEGSARRCFTQKNDEEFFTHTKFDIKVFASKSFNSHFLTTVARIRNNLAMALLNVVTPMPKIIFIMPEDDIIKEIRTSKDETLQYLVHTQDVTGLTHVLGRNIEWLLHEVRKLLAAHNDALPKKAQKNCNVVWVLPSRHMNYANDLMREILGNCIESIVEIHNERNFALSLKQNWDQYDPSIYFSDSQRYSNEGLNRLWRAFDRTVWYANVLITKNENRKFLNKTRLGEMIITEAQLLVLLVEAVEAIMAKNDNSAGLTSLQDEPCHHLLRRNDVLMIIITKLEPVVTICVHMCTFVVLS